MNRNNDQGGKHALKAAESGITETANPSTPTGVGLPRVVRKLPVTSVFGERKRRS